MENISHYLPILKWLPSYNKSLLVSDLIAGFVVTVLLIPQSLAYAILAGVPAEVGLYASITPLVIYALLGSSRTLSVGPVAVISLMTATTLGNIVAQGSSEYLNAAITLAALSGIMLLLMGILKLGLIANFLSHSVISGFITASGVIIALSQLKHIFGVQASGDTLSEILHTFSTHAHQTNVITLILGLCALLFLICAKKYATTMLRAFGLSDRTTLFLAKISPIIAVISTILVAYIFDLQTYEVALVGHIPSGLPTFSLTLPSWELVKTLTLPAFFISIIGYIESVSVGKTLAAKRRQKIDPNQELIGLGSANIASAIAGAFPVTGGFSRSVVNFDAGASTQAASIFAAIGIGLAALFLTPVLFYLPKATLAATIIVAVISLIDLSIFKKTWKYDKHDFLAVSATVCITLFYGVEKGVSAGIIASILLHLYRASKPHIAEVGLVAGTEHFRNIRRYHVQTHPHLLSLRIDESLYFINANFLEDAIYSAIYQRDEIYHVILMCSAVNEIDYSALETLETINTRLASQGVTLHLSEVKGPVMDALKKSGFPKMLSGNIYLTQFQAVNEVLKDKINCR
ncbi:SulP family inorganic anion transporter [Agarilytica rhodophyticola]|uniref:SulP family inorganic anion transporter n=1 Tax=Agarilytica rhodophyticola TaxID=1737490 RepID=UPI000B3446C6|nr:sulfate permease [Agarilytica rhodophyticola]